jgi:hypothetical protein
MKRGQDIELVRGDDLTVAYTVYDEAGAAKVITGASIAAKFRDSRGVAKITKTSASETQIKLTTPASGKFELYFVPADTTGLKPGIYAYDIEITLSGKIATVASGNLILLADQTYT